MLINPVRARRRSVIIAIAAALLLCFVVVFIIGSRTFLKKKADTNQASNVLTVSGTITYKDSKGNSVTEESSSSVAKVNPLRVQATLKGRDITKSKPIMKFSFVDPAADQLAQDSSESLSASANANNEAEVDWTALANIDPQKQYDLRITSPGFLSRLIPDITISNTSRVLQTNSLIAGDLNQDHKINWEDYFAWKANYGQTVAGDPSDFNGDGTVNYKDYALSFGTLCYNANEANQDDRCKQ